MGREATVKAGGLIWARFAGHKVRETQGEKVPSPAQGRRQGAKTRRTSVKWKEWGETGAFQEQSQ